MKQILPILTLTTLSAAAFADAGAAAPAAASGLSYNRVSISRSGDSTGLAVSNLLNGGNVLVSIEQLYITTAPSGVPVPGNSGLAFISLGYVFKNVVSGIDATVSIGSSSNGAESSYGVNLCRSLSEVVAGLEFSLGYQHANDTTLGKVTAWNYELSYNINSKFSVAYGISDPSGTGSNVNTASIRYNY